MKNDDLEHFDEELFDSLDEAGRHAVAAVFLEHAQYSQRLGYT